MYRRSKADIHSFLQVLEEMQGDTVVKSYTIVHDVFLEAIAANQVRHLLNDGHGSTRLLVDALGNVLTNDGTPQVFAYDAYGLPIGFDLADALTTHLDDGERTDQLTGLQYLRARYYNPATGTFNRLDPFAGNNRDPQSLHKYLYTHGDPVNGIDPSGKMSMAVQLGSLGTLGGLFATTTAAVSQAGGRGLGYGMATGIVGGSALATAIGLRQYGAIRDGALASIVSVCAIYGLDSLLGEDTSNKGWEYTSIAFEAFSWQTAGSLAHSYAAHLGADLESAHFGNRLVLAGLEWVAQTSTALITGLTDIVAAAVAVRMSGSPIDPSTELFLRNSVKDTVANVAAGVL
jgi:RHS repeat-associated protein